MPQPTKGTTVTTITSANPIRKVELRESEWNSILEATLYAPQAAVTNPAKSIQQQLATYVNSEEEPRGVTVVGSGLEAESFDYPLGDDWTIERGELTITDLDNNTQAAFAAGAWTRVFVTPQVKVVGGSQKDSGDVIATS